MGRSSGRSDVRPVRGACVADRLDRRVWPRAYDVARRTRELGIRMALGATTGDIKRLVLRQGFKAAAVGLSLGLLLAVGIGRLVSSLLYRVSPLDPAAGAHRRCPRPCRCDASGLLHSGTSSDADRHAGRVEDGVRTARRLGEWQATRPTL